MDELLQCAVDSRLTCLQAYKTREHGKCLELLNKTMSMNDADQRKRDCNFALAQSARGGWKNLESYIKLFMEKFSLEEVKYTQRYCIASLSMCVALSPLCRCNGDGTHICYSITPSVVLIQAGLRLP